ncbi:MAG: PBSX family phage terminase large subunit [Parachlamydia sp.]|nr:PBSX family phage terminase large subunit [Parachlamydia sp.]
MNSLSDKQLDSLSESNAKINIWEGAVRSGKTYISLWRWMKELTYGPAGEYCIITRTYDTFKRNILPLITNMVGADARYYAGRREMNMWGKTIHIIGADDSSADSKIRGATFSGAYVDEITMIPEAVFRMLISRCAMGGAKIFGTTNPDSPFHWLKKDFLDDNPDVKSWKFTLNDNPKLTKEEKDYLCRQYKGLWFQRFIEGRWVQAEGAIYDFFDPTLHVINFEPGLPEYCIIGIDYGTTNPCAFVSVSVNRSKYPNMWVDSVYYYDSKIHQRQKTDSEYAVDLIKFIKDKPVKAIYVDPSAASFKLELSRNDVSNLYDAENEVIDGIRLVSKFFNNGTIKICRSCDVLIKEMQGYVWDPHCAKTGKEQPLKHADHGIDALRYSLYTHFFGKDGNKMTARQLDSLYNESRGRGPELPAPFRPIEELDRYQCF